jgi:hypothetical protein
MQHRDIVCVVFEQLSPTETSFRYLTFLACVNKTWMYCAKSTRHNPTWLAPLIQRGLTYCDTLEHARCEPDLSSFIYGMVKYSWNQTVQDKIMEHILVPVSNSIVHYDALIQKFRQVSVATFFPLLSKISQRYSSDTNIFLGVCRIIGLWSGFDFAESDTKRTSIVMKDGFTHFIARGAIEHKDTIDSWKSEMILAALVSIGHCDHSIMVVAIEYLRSFPHVRKIVHNVLCLIMNRACGDSEEYNVLILDLDVISLIVRVGLRYTEDAQISCFCCRIVGHFAANNDNVRDTFVQEKGVVFITNVMRQHVCLASTNAIYFIAQAITSDPRFSSLLFEHDIIKNMVTRLLQTNIVLGDVDTVVNFTSLLFFAVNNKINTLSTDLLGYGIMRVLEQFATVHPLSLAVYRSVVCLLAKLSDNASFKSYRFSEALVKILGSNFRTVQNNAVMVIPMLTVFATIIDSHESNLWSHVFRFHLTHIMGVMKIHTTHFEVQRASCRILMLLAQKRQSHMSTLYLESIDLVLLAVNNYSDESIYGFALQFFTSLMVVVEYREHMARGGAIFVILEILRNTRDARLVGLCLLFLSRLNPGDHNSHNTGRLIRNMSTATKQRSLYNISNVDKLIRESLLCDGVTSEMNELAQRIRHVKMA